MSEVAAETAQERADREIRERLNDPQNLHVLSVNAGYRAMLAAGRRWSEADAAKQNVDASWVE
jgi:hypothetical protein